MNKLFKPLFAALAIVLVALTSCDKPRGPEEDFAVDCKIRNPSGKKIHVDFNVYGKFKDEDGQLKTVGEGDVSAVYIFVNGLDSKYHYQTGAYNQVSGSFDFEVDEATCGVEVHLRAVVGPLKRVSNERWDFWIQDVIK